MIFYREDIRTINRRGEIGSMAGNADNPLIRLPSVPNQNNTLTLHAGIYRGVDIANSPYPDDQTHVLN